MPRKIDINDRLDKVKERLVTTLTTIVNTYGIDYGGLEENVKKTLYLHTDSTNREFRVVSRKFPEPYSSSQFETSVYEKLFIEEINGKLELKYECYTVRGFYFDYAKAQEYRGYVKNRTAEELIYLLMAVKRSLLCK